MVCHFVHVKGRSCIERINVLVVRETILHHVWEYVRKGVLEFIVCENSAAPKRVLKTTAMSAKLPYATKYVGEILATTIICTTEVHVLELLERVLTDLVPWISVVPYIRSHQHAQFLVVCIGLILRVWIVVTDQPLEALESFPGQTFLQILKSPGVFTSAGYGTTDYLKPVEDFDQEKFD